MKDIKNAYTLLLYLSDELRHASYERKVIEEKFHGNSFTRNVTSHTAVAVKDLKWTNVAEGMMKTLTKPAQLFVLHNVMDALKQLNMLWYWPPTRKSHEKIILKELIEKKILFKTETTGIYLVNPIKIWRGSPIVCVEATKDLLRVNGKPCPELIRDLRGGDKYTTKTTEDQYDALTNNGFTPNLLGEDAATYGQS